MAGLARLLHGAGYRVSGCDSSATSPYRPWLEASGIPCATGHSPDHLAGVDAVVRTAAAPLSLPEIRQAPRLLDRGCLLAALFDRFPATIAVCGTHGKTTTASFTATLLQQAGFRPGWCIGGTCASLGDVLASPPGGPDAPFVAECDESDGTLSLYHPLVTVITSTEFDHAEHYSGPDEFRSVFATVARQTRGTLVYHENCQVEGHACPDISYGFSPSARLRATNVSGTSFDIVFDGTLLGRYTLPVPGRHNILNFLAAKAYTSKRSGLFRTTSSVCVPIEPVEPNMASLFLKTR